MTEPGTEAADTGSGTGAPMAAPSQTRSSGRPRYGRMRGRIPVGTGFVARLGPGDGEPFAAIDDPTEDWETAARPHGVDLIENLRFVALDCETTGQLRHQVVELGAVAFTLDHHIMSFETLVHSTDRINPYARRIHGISSETLGGAPSIVEVLERFRRFARGAVLVEHSADAFDTRLLGRAMGKPLDADNIDTSRLAAKLWNLRDTIGLERLCDELGVGHRRPHHALADAEATAACFVRLVARGREQCGWRTLGDLLADGQPPQRFDINGAPLAGGGGGGRTRSRSRRRSRGGAGRRPSSR